jgi:hypothetical protein
VLHGDLSNVAEPTILFTWEGLLANVPEELANREQRLLERGKWRKVLACWEENPHMRKVLVDLQWRKSRQIEVLTYYPWPFFYLLKERLDDEGYPYAGLVCGWPKEDFASQLAGMPWVTVVYHSEPRFLYGSKGQYVDPSFYMGADL